MDTPWLWVESVIIEEPGAPHDDVKANQIQSSSNEGDSTVQHAKPTNPIGHSKAGSPDNTKRAKTQSNAIIVLVLALSPCRNLPQKRITRNILRAIGGFMRCRIVV